MLQPAIAKGLRLEFFVSTPTVGTPIRLRVKSPMIRKVGTVNQAGLTSVKTAAYSVPADQSGVTIINTGATAIQVNTLPKCATGLEFTFVCDNANGIRATAIGADVIQFGTTLTAAAGSVTSTALGSVLTLEAISSTKGVATTLIGTWA